MNQFGSLVYPNMNVCTNGTHTWTHRFTLNSVVCVSQNGAPQTFAVTFALNVSRITTSLNLILAINMFRDPNSSTVHDVFSSSKLYVARISWIILELRLNQPTWCKLTIYIAPHNTFKWCSLVLNKFCWKPCFPSDCHRHQSSRCSWQLCNALVVRSSRWSAEKKEATKKWRPKIEPENYAENVGNSCDVKIMWSCLRTFQSRAGGARESCAVQFTSFVN